MNIRLRKVHIYKDKADAKFLKELRKRDSEAAKFFEEFQDEYLESKRGKVEADLCNAGMQVDIDLDNVALIDSDDLKSNNISRYITEASQRRSKSLRRCPNGYTADDYRRASGGKIDALEDALIDAIDASSASKN